LTYFPLFFCRSAAQRSWLASRCLSILSQPARRGHGFDQRRCQHPLETGTVPRRRRSCHRRVGRRRKRNRSRPSMRVTRGSRPPKAPGGPAMASAAAGRAISGEASRRPAGHTVVTNAIASKQREFRGADVVVFGLGGSASIRSALTWTGASSRSRVHLSLAAENQNQDVLLSGIGTSDRLSGALIALLPIPMTRPNAGRKPTTDRR
jgi:hypothetical protein